MSRFQNFFNSITCCSILFSQPVFSQNLDPTFNGLANTIHCSVGAIVPCSDDYCSVLPAGDTMPGNNIWISLKGGRIAAQSQFDGSDARTMKIEEVSPAALNSQLYVKFKVQRLEGSKPSNGLLLFVPSSGGNYRIFYGEATYPVEKSNAPLPVTQVITGGSCEIEN